ncbi:nuclear transport factor 2 family protein [Streptomyces sp. NPDC002285]
MSKENVSIVKAYWDRAEHGDLDAWGEVLADDAMFVDNTFGRSVTGKKEFLAELRRIFQLFPDVAASDVQFLDADEQSTVIVICTWGGTDTGTGFMGFPATGRTAARRFCVAIKFDHQERVVAQENFYDALGFLVQLGHVDQPVSPALKAEVPSRVGVQYSS